MASSFDIKPLRDKDISVVTSWSRLEGFAPGVGDVSIYKNTDNQGIWIGWLDDIPIGCIAGIKYNQNYGFIGLFIILKEYRGNGYGVCLWQHALNYLADLPCIGLEAALDRIKDYSKWGFASSSFTTRWQTIGNSNLLNNHIQSSSQTFGLKLVEGSSIPSSSVQTYDAKREPSPRPHFLSDWLHHPAGNVLALMDDIGRYDYQTILYGYGNTTKIDYDLGPDEFLLIFENHEEKYIFENLNIVFSN